jgi:conjugal transfer pilus assembly protein TraF
MRKPSIAMAFIVLTVLWACRVPAATGDGAWWHKSDQGWFFYHDAPLSTKPEAKPQPSPTPAPTGSPELFTARMQKKGQELLSKALEYPTAENVRAYMEYNKLMLNISGNFALAWKKVLMENPQLGTDVPVEDSDYDIYYKQKQISDTETLRSLAGRAGLFFFYRSSCPYCQRQARYLSQFLAEFPFFTVKAVSIDGGALPEFSDTMPDNGISERLGVTTVPAIFLAFPPNNFARISTGIINSRDLERSLLDYVQKVDTDYSGTATSY